jgi:hypothetical protein
MYFEMVSVIDRVRDSVWLRVYTAVNYLSQNTKTWVTLKVSPRTSRFVPALRLTDYLVSHCLLQGVRDGGWMPISSIKIQSATLNFPTPSVNRALLLFPFCFEREE